MKKIIITLLLTLAAAIGNSQTHRTFRIDKLSHIMPDKTNPIYPIRLIQQDSTNLYVVTDYQMQYLVENTIDRKKLAIAIDSMNRYILKLETIDEQHQKVRDLDFSIMEYISKTNSTLSSEVNVKLSGISLGIQDIDSNLVDLNEYLSRDKKRLRETKWWRIPLAAAATIGAERAGLGDEVLIAAGVTVGSYIVIKTLF